MNHADWLNKQAQITLNRLLPRIQSALSESDHASAFLVRLNEQFPRIFSLLHTIYGDHYDFFYHLEQIMISAARMYIDRPADLKALDGQRELQPLWFQSEKMLGGVCYVDLFAGNLAGLREKIPYFKELGLTYLHLMPLFKVPENDSDGGYAISDYRSVNPVLGSMDELRQLAGELRKNGISLVLDFVFNHTASEHLWAKKALAGDEEYQHYYFMFDDRTLPDQYQRHLREIFPEQSPGNFTFQPEVSKWVWTTFRHFQWDLNYRNPAVFNAMLQEMLFLANQGVEVLRLDAVAFIWKQMGTSCENLPQAHTIIQAYNALVRLAAPSLLFKSEAIVHPDDVASYVSWDESPISYNPTLMALLWESLATRDVKLLRYSMQKRFALSSDCAWVNYVRVHDDIGWTFADEDAAAFQINGFDHRQFLNRFYTGRFEGSFARGVAFNYNPINQDMRICGTTASLAGLEQALELGNETAVDHAIARILLIHSVILSVGGIPLIYLGDEVAMLNDYGYLQDSAKKADSRWIHRPEFDWKQAAHRTQPNTLESRLFQMLIKLITIRKRTPAFAAGNSQFFDSGSTHVLAYICAGSILVLANFSEQSRVVVRNTLDLYVRLPDDRVRDMVTGKNVPLDHDITLAPYQFMWIPFSQTI